MANKPKPAGDEKAAGGGGKKGLILIGGGVFLLLALGIGGWLIFGGKSAPPEGEEGSEHAEDKDKGKVAAPIYLAFEPPFTVNLADPGANRYLQVEVQVMARNQATIDAVKLHTPAIRDRLLSLFGQQTVESVRAGEAREALQAKALEEIQAILKKESVKPGLEALYFTSFVTQ